jgi:pantoate--beta-alanine ligase
MEIFTEIVALRAFLSSQKTSNKSIGFVPTMGALHAGHLTLIKASKQQNDLTVCSIFVNPTQFNNTTDLAKYPKTIEQDTHALRSVGCEVLFCPSKEDIYPHPPVIRLSFGDLEHIMEGKFRPGHFSGVAQIVAKLLHIVEPDHAYFGQKDFQQLKIVETLVSELNFNVSIKSIPTQREHDGLAMSSRNMRLNQSQREQALIFYKSLLLAKKRLGEGVSFNKIQEEVSVFFESQPGVKLEYLEIADVANLTSKPRVTADAVLLIAGYVGEVRLIDNLLMTE